MTTPTAEEIARDVLNWCDGIFDDSEFLEKVTQALESYAEARVEETVGNICYWCLEKTPKNDGHICPHLEKARAEGFREAIERSLEIYHHSGTSEEVEKRLLALKPDGK